MALFELLAFLGKLLGGLNVPNIEEKITAWLKDKGVQYPDLRARTDALATWLGTTLAEVQPNLEIGTMRDTLWGIASDIVHGTASVDPGAWMGGG